MASNRTLFLDERAVRLVARLRRFACLVACTACSGDPVAPAHDGGDDELAVVVAPLHDGGGDELGVELPIPEATQDAAIVDAHPPSRSAASTCDAERELLRGTSHNALRRLSKSELSGTLRALLGPLADEKAIAQRLASLPSDQTMDAGDFADTITPGLPTVLRQVAEHAVSAGLEDPAWRTSLASCATQPPVTDECVETIVRQYGARVWRRDLVPSEVESYLDFYAQAGAGEAGLGFLLRRLLQSPSLVFHLEVGTDEGSEGRVRLSDFEVASRLAYTLTDSMPDVELMDAARGGELGSPRAIQAHAERLLNTALARAKALDFARYYTRLDALADPSARAAAQAGISEVAGLGEEMRQEAFEFFYAVVFTRKGTFADLMLSTDAYPRSVSLAQIFASSGAVADTGIHAPKHVGLLHRPALLASSGERTNPILRGAHVRKRFLCADLALPGDIAVTDVAQNLLDTHDPIPNRQAVTQATAEPTCQRCHTLINPLGFVFEGFDPLGKPRSEEVILAEDGSILHRFPIDTYVEEPRIESGGPKSLSDSSDLAHAIALSDIGRQCLAQRLLEYYRRRLTHPDTDACLLNDAFALGVDASIQQVIVSLLAGADIFWKEANK